MISLPAHSRSSVLGAVCVDPPEQLNHAWHRSGRVREVVIVPYNAQLAARVRGALSDRDHVREVRMFGGLALMVDDRMVVCVAGGGSDLLVRVAPERDAELVAKPGADRAQMGKERSMGEGWIAVDEQALRSDDDLQYWLDVALDFHARGSGRPSRRTPRNVGL